MTQTDIARRAGAGEAGPELAGRYRAAAGEDLLPVRVRADDGRETPALLALDASGPTARLIAARGLLGRKAVVVAPRPDGGEPETWAVRVLWVMRLGDHL